VDIRSSIAGKDLSSPNRFDLIVIGAGIAGLAHAYTAALRGLRVAVVERDRRCVGASIRNFGFVTVTGQRAGDTWRRAMRSSEIWADIATAADIPVLHRGLWMIAQRPAARQVLEAFMHTPMAEACRLLEPAEATRLAPALSVNNAGAVLHSPHELRVESRQAIPRLAAWLAEAHGVRFFYGETVTELALPRVRTSARTLFAERAVLCSGADLTGLAAPWLSQYPLALTRLQMLRVRPPPGFKLPGAVMSDLGLVRYAGYAALPESQALLCQLEQEVPESLAHGIHLIAVQSADGTLVVGDSHHNDEAPEPFASETVDRLILAHLHESLALDECEVVERWTGVYPVGHTADCLIEAPDPALRVVLVTSGTGASTAFGIAEDVFSSW
jgi:FAD dependent oxidoreductase TIGR03364